MKSIKYFTIIFSLLAFILCSNVNYAQELKKDISEMTKEDVLKMSYDDLLVLPFEDLMKLADIVGVSADELLELILNMNVSTASKKVETVFESPLSTTVIPKEEIEQSGVTTIEELFRLAPGIIVREKSNGNFDVHIRGNDNVPPGNFSHFTENSMTLVMIDNRIVYNYINGGTFWETLPISLEDIERVDIIRGPSSALYGPNAVSGVINFITKKPEDQELNIHGKVQYGSLNTTLASISASSGITDNLSFRVSGNIEGRNRAQETYYSYVLEDYVPKANVMSLFGYPYNDHRLPDPELSKNRLGLNGSLFYDLDEKTKFTLCGGFQNSEVQTIFFENLATPFANRESKTGYFDIKANVHGFSGQISYLSGTQDLSKGMSKPVIKYDMSTLNANLEYNFNYKNLNIRPGIGYQKASYDDAKHVEKAQLADPTREGLLNGEQSLSNFSVNLRADYTAFEKLRLIAAIRNDKYDKPDANYLSYQFISSLNINDNHIVRAVYSRANRGAFIGDIYANFENPLGSIGEVMLPGIPTPVLIENYYQYYIGNDQLDLLTMDMIEIGFRNKISKTIQTDFELFYTQSEDFDILAQQEIAFVPTAVIDLGGEVFLPTAGNMYDSLMYENIDVVSKQIGISGSVNIALSKKLLVKAFATFQETKLENFETNDTTINAYHKWTPKIYGGFSINYSPIEKLNIYTNTYFYDEQLFSRYQLADEIAENKILGKGITNIKVSYKFWNESTIFINARNAFGFKDKEFGFADETKGLYLVGLNMKF